ncbi:hypothetical protein CY34DRAFT_787670 [Suillus luteus UH-Slu-Lm8-n1]|uniref:Uncharacterized protein n=1 Tax=Suillus luteus UH-Slu-Lm8-n1 TaxID=930992 RepID=A0A0C9Z9C6_9AGAM|nr:hypothetical protein CY34DRAFT_787670 [Suillus luteus UH-Slu-Lm8-n1]
MLEDLLYASMIFDHHFCFAIHLPCPFLHFSSYSTYNYSNDRTIGALAEPKIVVGQFASRAFALCFTSFSPGYRGNVYFPPS